MSVKIRLRRMGRKKLPFYRIVATDSRARRDGKYLEKIGHYNPVREPVEYVIDKEKAFKWLGRGAIPSDTVRNLFSKQGIMFEWDLRKRGYDQSQIEAAMSQWNAAQEEKIKRQEAREAMMKRETETKKPEEESKVNEKAEAQEPEPEPEPEPEAKEEETQESESNEQEKA